jgi:hypothetical protein
MVILCIQENKHAKSRLLVFCREKNTPIVDPIYIGPCIYLLAGSTVP